MTLRPDTFLAIPILVVGLTCFYAALRRRTAQGRPVINASAKAARGTLTDVMVVSLLVWTFQFTVSTPEGTEHWAVLAGIAVVTITGLIRSRTAESRAQEASRETDAV